MSRLSWWIRVGIPALAFCLAVAGLAHLAQAPPYELDSPLLEQHLPMPEPPSEGVGAEVLAGRVLEADGTPAVRLLVLASQAGRVHRTTTSEDGRFQLERLSAGEVLLDIVGVDRLPETFSATLPGPAIELHLAAGLVTPDPLTPPAKSPLEVELRVPSWDPEGAADLRLVLLPLESEGESPRAPRVIDLKKDGTGSLGDLPHGQWTLRLLEGHLPLTSEQDLLAPPGDASLVLDHPRDQTLGLVARHSGLVGGPDEDGQPSIAGARIVVARTSAPSQPVAATTADGEGRWSVGRLPAGSWLVRWQRGKLGGSTQVELESGAQTRVRLVE